MSSSKYRNFDVDNDSTGGEALAGVSSDTGVSFRVGTNFWKTRTFLEKCLCIVLAVFILLVIILGALLGTKHNEVTQLKQEKEGNFVQLGIITMF